jgi:Sulfotransferase domain
MRVIGAGFGRTGTMSLKAALEELGFGPCFHMIDLLQDPERVPLWQAAVDGEDVDWDEAFDGYESTVDWPGCTFWRQLTQRYPEAPVVLTVRDPDAWYESTRRTIFEVREAAMKGELDVDAASLTAPPEAMRMIGGLIWEGTFDGRFLDRSYAIDAFNRHNEAVIASVPRRRLLVHEIQDGWEPLAMFLGAEIPDTEFPHLNDTDAFRRMVGMRALRSGVSR